MMALTAPLFAGENFAEWARVQLRCKDYVEVSSDSSQRLSRALPAVGSGIVLPNDNLDRLWPIKISRDHLMPRAVAFAEEGTRRDSSNPDAFYYLGEARHFDAVFAETAAATNERFAPAAAACEKACQLFPMDVRILLHLGRANDIAGMPAAAANYVSKAIAADPKLGNVYAYYGFHLWKQKKLTRAEAYYQRALALDGANKVARAGLRDIERLRLLSQNLQHVELYGDPLESFDLDPPSEDDERRGVRLNE